LYFLENSPEVPSTPIATPSQTSLAVPTPLRKTEHFAATENSEYIVPTTTYQEIISVPVTVSSPLKYGNRKSQRHIYQVEQDGAVPFVAEIESPPVLHNQITVNHEEFHHLIHVAVPQANNVVEQVAANETVYDENYFDDDYVNEDNNSQSESDSTAKTSIARKRKQKNSKTIAKRKCGSPQAPAKPKSRPRPNRKRKRTPYVRPEGVKARYVKPIVIPIVKDSEGREFLRDIEIKTILDGYECGECGLQFLETTKLNSKYNIRNHIRGVHFCNNDQ